MILSLRNDEHTDRYRRGFPLVSEGLPTGHRTCPHTFPVRTNVQINPVR